MQRQPHALSRSRGQHQPAVRLSHGEADKRLRAFAPKPAIVYGRKASLPAVSGVAGQQLLSFNSRAQLAMNSPGRGNNCISLAAGVRPLHDGVRTHALLICRLPSGRGGALSNWDRITKALQQRSGTS